MQVHSAQRHTLAFKIFDDLYADLLTWLESERVDYLASQVYWSMNFEF